MPAFPPSTHQFLPSRIFLILGILLLIGLFGFLPHPTTAAPTNPSTLHLDAPPTGTPYQANTSGTATSTSTVHAQREPLPLESGDSYWRGWHVTFNATELITNPARATEQNRTFQIRRVTETDRIGERLTTFTVDNSGTHTIDTSPFKGPVVILYKSDVVYVTNGTGYNSNPPNNTSVTITNSKWVVPQQTLNISWEDNPVYPDQLTQLDLSSNRDSFTLGVKATGLSYSDLTAIFPEEHFAENHDAHRTDNALLLDGQQSAQLLINTSGISPGDYAFEFYSTDSLLRVNSTVNVLQPQPDSQFESVQRSQHTGDIVTTTITCDQCYLLIGGPDDGIIELIQLTDQNNDQTINLRINTRYAGLYLGHPGVSPKNISAYRAGPDDATRIHSSVLLDSRRTLSKIRTELGFAPHGLDVPLGPGLYDLTLTDSTYLLNQPSQDSETLLIRDHTDKTTIRLTDPSLDSIESFTAPPGMPRDLTLGTISASATQRDTVVLGDQLIFKIDISGIFGYLSEEHNDDIAGITYNEDEGISLQITGTRFTAPSKTIDLESSRARLLPDPSNNALYVAIDTRYLRPASLTREQPFTATVRLSGVSSERSQYSITGPEANYHGYPYLLPGVQDSVQTTVRLQPPTNAAVVNNQQNGSLRLPNEFAVPISGETLVAPGSRLTITATHDVAHEWETTGTAIVQPDGTWHTTIDYSQAGVGQTFTLTVQQKARTLTTTEGVIVESTTSQQTPGPTPTTPTTPTGTTQTPITSPPETPTATQPPDTSTPATSTPTGPATPTEPPQEPTSIFNALLPNLPALTGTLGLIALLTLGLGTLSITGFAALTFLRR